MSLSDYPDLHAVVTAIADAETTGGTRRSWNDQDSYGNPYCGYSAVIPGHNLLPDPAGEYSHVISRQSVIGGEEISWIGQTIGKVPGPNGDPYGPITPAPEGLIESLWAEIAAALD